MSKKMWNRKSIRFILGAFFGMLCILPVGMTAYGEAAKEGKEAAAANNANGSETVPKGIFVNGTDVSGKTAGELDAVLEQIGEQLKAAKITLSIDDHQVPLTFEELGIEMNTEKTKETIFAVGNKGNIVVRYKELKDAERETLRLYMQLEWDEAAAEEKLNEACKPYEQPATDYSLEHQGSEFVVKEGAAGYQVAKEEARKLILEALGGTWSGEDITIELALEESQPKGSVEELSKVKDMLGECTTSYSSSSSARAKNVERGASLVKGTLLYPGEECSFASLVGPVEVDNGYFMAPSYESGQVVESAGGGICQVSTTLYGALLQAELKIVERSNHSMLVNYVEPAMDAAIAGDYKDLKFQNDKEAPIYIEAKTENRHLTFQIYGLETRPSNRRIEYKSIELESRESVVQLSGDGNIAAGTITTVQSPHRGCDAKLMKYVYENEVLVEETEVNVSNYRMTPKKISVGMATDNPDLAAALQAAVAANDLDAVHAALATYGTGGDAVPAAAPGEPAQQPTTQPAQPTNQPSQSPQQSATQPTNQPSQSPQQPATQATQPTTQATQPSGSSSAEGRPDSQGSATHAGQETSARKATLARKAALLQH